MKIWVTRTEPGASELAYALANAGYQVERAPVLAIRSVAFEAPRGRFDIGLFLSVNGVRFAAKRVAGTVDHRYAVGRKTQAALRQFGFTATVPRIATSEGLLDALPDPCGKRILLVTGVGGRNLLPTALAKRGAQVTRLEVYLRYALTPKIDTASVGAIVISSGDGFRQAAQLWLGAAGDPQVPTLVPSARVASLGQRLGMHSVHDCGGANAKAVLRTLARIL